MWESLEKGILLWKTLIHPLLSNLPLKIQINSWNNLWGKQKDACLLSSPFPFPILLCFIFFTHFLSKNNSWEWLATCTVHLDSPKCHLHYGFHSVALNLSNSQMKASWAWELPTARLFVFKKCSKNGGGFVLFCLVLGIEHRALFLLGKHCTTELNSPASPKSI